MDKIENSHPPIGNTCGVIEEIKRYIQNTPNTSERDAALMHLETLRYANAELRKWGYEMRDVADDRFKSLPNHREAK